MNLLDRFRGKPHLEQGVGERFISFQEYYISMHDLITRLENSGHRAAASEVRSSLSHLNGLTIEWRLFMESLEKTLSVYGQELRPVESSDLLAVLQYAHRIVSRQKSKHRGIFNI